jgi:uncharacterized membrane protein HdeD (DUF308 family)
MKSSKESLSKTRVLPAAAVHTTGQGYSGISLSPPVQKKSNLTGLPDQLKEGVESLSGLSMDDVNVHYNSAQPEKLNARAYAQGSDIHLGAGQEKHLPHEAWHVVQQKEGRVRPTSEINGQPVNESLQLENEADVMGARAAESLNPVQKFDLHTPDLLTAVAQRSPGDEQLLRLFQIQAIKAELAYDLVVRQKQTALQQIGRLETIISIDTLNKHPDLMQVGLDVNQAAVKLRAHLDATAESVKADRNTVLAHERTASIKTPTEILEGWMNESIDQVNRIALEQAKLASSIVFMREKSVDIARIAMKMSETDVIKQVLGIADTLDSALEEGDKTVLELNNLSSGSTSAKEGLSLATAYSDSLNNASTGLAFGVVGAVDAGTAFSLSSTAGSVMGIMGGVLGILFGSIGTFLGIKNAILGGTKKSKLKKSKPKLSNEEMEAITDFAIHQKNKKIGRNIAGTAGGLIAISAGVLGIVALSVLTLGVAAIAVGIAAALIGLGIVGFKIIRKWWKRRSERHEFADELISQIKTKGDQAAEARSLIQNVGMNPDEVDKPKFRKQLISKVGDYAKSRRTQMAEGLVKALVDGKPSESFDAEIILTALGVEPGKIKSQVDVGNVGEAVGKVAKKLASW